MTSPRRFYNAFETGGVMTGPETVATSIADFFENLSNVGAHEAVEERKNE